MWAPWLPATLLYNAVRNTLISASRYMYNDFIIIRNAEVGSQVWWWIPITQPLRGCSGQRQGCFVWWLKGKLTIQRGRRMRGSAPVWTSWDLPRRRHELYLMHKTEYWTEVKLCLRNGFELQKKSQFLLLFLHFSTYSSPVLLYNTNISQIRKSTGKASSTS